MAIQDKRSRSFVAELSYALIGFAAILSLSLLSGLLKSGRLAAEHPASAPAKTAAALLSPAIPGR